SDRRDAPPFFKHNILRTLRKFATGFLRRPSEPLIPANRILALRRLSEACRRLHVARNSTGFRGNVTQMGDIVSGRVFQRNLTERYAGLPWRCVSRGARPFFPHAHAGPARAAFSRVRDLAARAERALPGDK